MSKPGQLANSNFQLTKALNGSSMPLSCHGITTFGGESHNSSFAALKASEGRPCLQRANHV